MKRPDEEWLDPAKLLLDQRNPRIPDEEFNSQDDALAYLAENAAIQELVNSISYSGWLDYEPLLVLRATSEVIEGNRRLAALRLIRDPALAKTFGIKIPDVVEDPVPSEIRAWMIDDRRDARDFIGFKHINGPFKWDSFAKAKYADDWLQDGETVGEVSQRLGDTHKTVERLVNGYRVLQQGERIGFDRSEAPGRFAFSHLYTGLTRPSIREYLGLPDAGGLLDENPIPDDHTGKLLKLLVWMHGDENNAPLIKSQNPHLKYLSEVLASPAATKALEVHGTLEEAYSIVEDRSARFSEALYDVSATVKRLASLQGDYDGDQSSLDIAEASARTLRGVVSSMRDQSRELEGS